MPEFIVPQELDGITVKNFLRRHCQVSARLLARLKRVENGMTVNGTSIKSIDRLRGGDTLCLVFPQDQCEIVPVNMPLSVVYEDADVLAVDKPPGLPVHPVHQYQQNTLANGVMAYARDYGASYTFRAVNRLDKDTSGLVLIAKNSYAHTFLAQHTQKIYLALCEGRIETDGVIDTPIRIKEGHTIQREVGEGGVCAVTHYHVLGHRNGHTDLELWLEYGRTHQIRTHLSSIGHPLAGDDMYGGHRDYFHRQCLHCAVLTFVHPLTKKTITVQSKPPHLFDFPEQGDPFSE